MVAQGYYGDAFLIPSLAYGQSIAGGNFPTDFNALPIKLDFTAFDGGFGETAGFKKSSSPEPFIDPYFGEFVQLIRQNVVIPQIARRSAARLGSVFGCAQVGCCPVAAV